MWAGWCAKVICDHLGLGHKTGLPYVHNADKANSPGSIQKDSKALAWQVRGVAMSVIGPRCVQT